MKPFRELVLERTHKLPWFPQYRVVVHDDGRVEWDGRAVVEHAGRAEWTITPESIQALNAAIAQTPFWKLESAERQGHWSTQIPLPSVSVIFQEGTTVNVNTVRAWWPSVEVAADEQHLKRLGDAIDRIVGTAPYVRAPHPAPKPSMSFYSLTLERGPCYGPCPVYAVNVGLDGRVDWIGDYWVQAQGERSWSVNADVLEKLRQSLVRAKFTSLDDRYDSAATDCPSATITVQFADGTTKCVYHYHGMYRLEDENVFKMLLWLENRIDRLLGTKDYIGKWSSDTSDK